MANLTYAKQGLQRLKEGAESWLRLSPNGGLVTTPGGASLQEAVRNGNVYVCETAVGGVAPGTAMSETTAFAFVLYNPVGSGVNLSVWRTSLGYISGTLGAGTVHYVASSISNTTAVTGTAIVPINCLLNSPKLSIALPLTTATIPAGPKILRPFTAMGASLASTAVAPWMATDYVDGEFVVTPGGYLALHSTAAGGSSPLVVIGMTFEEVPIVS